jgi:hypothetical protein
LARRRGTSSSLWIACGHCGPDLGIASLFHATVGTSVHLYFEPDALALDDDPPRLDLEHAE